MNDDLCCRRLHLRTSLVLLCLVVTGSVSMGYYHIGMLIPAARGAAAARGLDGGYSFGNDYYPVWLTARELQADHRDPYSPEVTREIQTGLFGRALDRGKVSDYSDLHAFAHPAFTDLLFWPLSELPFSVSRIVMALSLVVATLASVILWLRVLDWGRGWIKVSVVVLLTISSYSALEGFYAVQLGLLVAFLLAASLAALKGRRFLLAGFLMALTTIKPQVTGLVILYLVLWACSEWSSRKAFVAGLFSTGFVLLAASLVVLPDWIQSWFRAVVAYRGYAAPPLIAEVLTSFLWPRMRHSATVMLTVAAIFTAVILAWQNRKAELDDRKFWLTVCVLLAITVICILPGQAVYDHLILIPALLLVARDRGRLWTSGIACRVLLITGAVVFAWPWIAAFVLIVIRHWMAHAVFNSPAVLAMPIRTAASLPFAVLALLILMWRISVRERRVFS